VKALAFALLLCSTADAAPHDKIVWEGDSNPQGDKYTFARYGHCSLQFTDKGGVTRGQIETLIDLEYGGESFCLSDEDNSYVTGFVMMVKDRMFIVMAFDEPNSVFDPDFVASMKRKVNRNAKALKIPFGYAYRETGKFKVFAKTLSD
jgi:hypothetical protein